YVVYRTAEVHVAGHHANRLLVQELVAAEPATRAALWRYCLDVDLVSSVNVWNAPVDDPVRWMLAEPRRLRVTLASDFLWVRLLDVPAALQARRYDAPGKLVLDVVDPFRPQTAGRYALDAGPDGASCGRADRDADLTL